MKKFLITIISIIILLSVSSCVVYKADLESLESTFESEGESGSESCEEEVAFTFEDIPGFQEDSEGGADITITDLLNENKLHNNKSYAIFLSFDIGDIIKLFNKNISVAILNLEIKGTYNVPFYDIDLEIKGDINKGYKIMIRENLAYIAEFDIVNNKRNYNNPKWTPYYYEHSDTVNNIKEKLNTIEINNKNFTYKIYEIANLFFNNSLTKEPNLEIYYSAVLFNFTKIANNLKNLKNTKINDSVPEKILSSLKNILGQEIDYDISWEEGLNLIYSDFGTKLFNILENIDFQYMELSSYLEPHDAGICNDTYFGAQFENNGEPDKIEVILKFYLYSYTNEYYYLVPNKDDIGELQI